MKAIVVSRTQLREVITLLHKVGAGASLANLDIAVAQLKEILSFPIESSLEEEDIR